MKTQVIYTYFLYVRQHGYTSHLCCCVPAAVMAFFYYRDFAINFMAY